MNYLSPICDVFQKTSSELISAKLQPVDRLKSTPYPGKSRLAQALSPMNHSLFILKHSIKSCVFLNRWVCLLGFGVYHWLPYLACGIFWLPQFNLQRSMWFMPIKFRGSFLEAISVLYFHLLQYGMPKDCGRNQIETIQDPSYFMQKGKHPNMNPMATYIRKQFERVFTALKNKCATWICILDNSLDFPITHTSTRLLNTLDVKERVNMLFKRAKILAV